MKAGIPPALLGALAALAAGPSPALGENLANAPAPPAVSLPGAAVAATAGADLRTWIVGAGPGAGAIARDHGARRIAPRTWLVPHERARVLATSLRARGLLDYAEPNRLGRLGQTPMPDPLSQFAGWRDYVVLDQVPPPVTRESPLIGVVDTQIDVRHPEIAGSNIGTTSGVAVRDFHGTATSTVAAAPANGVGMLGIWPGARVLATPVPNGLSISCSDSTRAIAQALRAEAAVINMSYGSPTKCIAEEQQVLRAVQAGAVPVAAAGNELARGNPLEYPAGLAHVLTVGAVGPDDRPTGFSNESGAVDLSAPGTGILTAVPGSFDPDPTDDGFAFVDGTSFASPMVAAAVAWIRQARPRLTPFQAAQVVRLGARDVGEPGYDSASGFGVLNMPGALSRAAPRDDPLEPNDDVRYVDGRAFGKPARPLYRGRARTVAAVADFAEDPVDVYRVKLRPGQRLRLSLVPTTGDADLFVFGPRARSVRDSRSLRSSSRRGTAPERISIRNRAGRTRTFYVAVGFDADKRVELYNASYRLRVG